MVFTNKATTSTPDPGMLRKVGRGVAVALAVVLTLVPPPALSGREDVNARRPDGSTPLQWAVFNGDVPEAKRLIAAGADVRASNNYGVNALLLAADISSTELVQLLLKHGVGANSANPEGETAIHLLARSGNVEAAKLLLKAGAKVDPRENFGQQTPLMWAVARRQPAMVELLLGKGADPDARGAVRDYQRVATAESRAKSMDRGGFTPLLYAARENCRQCVDSLIKHGADLNLPDPTGVVPMVIAMINGNTDIAKRLIEAGADVNQWDIFGQAPLHVAIATMGGGGGGRGARAGGGNPLDSDFPQTATGAELVQMLIARGANPNQQTSYPSAVRSVGYRGTTPFLVAVGTGNLDLVKQLLARGALVNLATAEGQGAIHAAVQARGGGGPGGGFPGGAPAGGDDDGVEPAAAAPAAVSAAPAAAAAPRAGGPPRGGGAGPGARGSGAGPGAGGGGAGGGAAAQVELIKYLAAQGADVHIMAERNWRYRTRGGSALHYAVRGGNLQIVQAVVELGVDVNVKDDDGLTALDYAMARGHLGFQQQRQPPNKPIADYLRSKGANVELERVPDWKRDGAPLSTNAYDSILWPVDPKGP
jgi:ankyrin repeat protein